MSARRIGSHGRGRGRDDLLIRLSLSALMVALSIVLCRWLGISPGDSMFRVELGFLPIAMLGYLAGPLWSAAAYGVADLVGSLLTTGMNPLILLCKILSGGVMGLFFHRKRPGVLRSLIAFLSIALVVDVFAMSGVFRLYGYAPTYLSALCARGINAAVNLPIRISLTWAVFFCGGDVFSRYIGYFDFKKRGRSMKKESFSAYANSFQAVSRLGLERISELLARLGQPESRLRCLHIAGTNGKGSVAAYLSSILSSAGCRVGLYTSPNLVSVRERIRVNGRMISEADLAGVMERVEAACSSLSEMPTQFEIWTAAAFLYFDEAAVDYVVLETGLGGEFDATNVIPANVMSIFTKIDLDHTQYLGNTIAEIAKTKSRIMKSACESGVVISAPQVPEAAAALSETARENNLTIRFVEIPEPSRFEGICERFSYLGLELAPSLGGTHQIENAAIAVSAARTLGISDAAILRGIAAASHPARLELLSRDPVILYDGGHNPNGIAALNASLARYFPNTPMTVIFAAMADKEVAPSLAALAEPGREFIFTTVQGNPRAASPALLSERAEACGISGRTADTLAAAIEMAKNDSRMILICGSLYLYADLPEKYRSI